MSGTEDVLAKLLPATFRDVRFFASNFTFDFTQQHVPALYPDRDGGNIDATGRNPSTHQFTAVFNNGILLATEAQYPGVWRKMVSACLDRSSATLLHPELGPLKVKCASCSTRWDSQRRGGVEMALSFVETSDEEDELAKIFAKDAAYAVEFEAGQLDKVSTVGNLAAADDDLSPSLLESIKKLTGAIAMFENDLGRVAAIVESYANALGDLTDRIEGLNDPANSPAIEALKRMYDAVLGLVDKVKPKGRPVTMVIVARDGPTSAVAAAFSNTLEELLRLNPAAGSRTSLSAGDSLFVYA